MEHKGRVFKKLWAKGRGISGNEDDQSQPSQTLQTRSPTMSSSTISPVEPAPNTSIRTVGTDPESPTARSSQSASTVVTPGSHQRLVPAISNRNESTPAHSVQLNPVGFGSWANFSDFDTSGDKRRLGDPSHVKFSEDVADRNMEPSLSIGSPQSSQLSQGFEPPSHSALVQGHGVHSDTSAPIFEDESRRGSFTPFASIKDFDRKFSQSEGGSVNGNIYRRVGRKPTGHVSPSIFSHNENEGDEDDDAGGDQRQLRRESVNPRTGDSSGNSSAAAPSPSFTAMSQSPRTIARDTHADFDQVSADSIARDGRSKNFSLPIRRSQFASTPAARKSSILSDDDRDDANMTRPTSNMVTAAVKSEHFDSSNDPSSSSQGSSNSSSITSPTNDAWQSIEKSNEASPALAGTDRLGPTNDRNATISSRQYQIQGSSVPIDINSVLDLSSTTDTTTSVRQAPAVTHETVYPQVHNIREEQITREIHYTDVYHRILPINDIEVLPARHYIYTADKELVEVSPSVIPGRKDATSEWATTDTSSSSSSLPAPIMSPPTSPRLQSFFRPFTARLWKDGEGDRKDYVDSNGVHRTETTWVYPPTLQDGGRITGQTEPVYFNDMGGLIEQTTGKMPGGWQFDGSAGHVKESSSSESGKRLSIARKPVGSL